MTSFDSAKAPSLRKKLGDLVVPIGSWDILLFDENAEIGSTIHWKPEHVALIIGMKTLNDTQGRTRLIEVLTPQWCRMVLPIGGSKGKMNPGDLICRLDWNGELNPRLLGVLLEVRIDKKLLTWIYKVAWNDGIIKEHEMGTLRRVSVRK